MSLLCCRRSILWSSRAARQSKGIRRRSFPNNISLRLAHTRAYFNILRALCASAWAPIEKSRTEPTEPRRYHPAAGVSRRGAESAEKIISVSPWPPCEAPFQPERIPHILRALCASACPPHIKASHRVHGATEIPSDRRKSHAEAQRAQRKISVSPCPPCEAPFQPERIPHILRALCVKVSHRVHGATEIPSGRINLTQRRRERREENLRVSVPSVRGPLPA